MTDELLCRICFSEGDVKSATNDVIRILEESPNSPISSLGFRIARLTDDLDLADRLRNLLKARGTFNAQLAIEHAVIEVRHRAERLQAHLDDVLEDVSQSDEAKLISIDRLLAASERPMLEDIDLSSSSQVLITEALVNSMAAGDAPAIARALGEVIVEKRLNANRFRQFLERSAFVHQPEILQDISLELARNDRTPRLLLIPSILAWSLADEPASARELLGEFQMLGCDHPSMFRIVARSFIRKKLPEEGAEMLLQCEIGAPLNFDDDHAASSRQILDRLEGLVSPTILNQIRMARSQSDFSIGPGLRPGAAGVSTPEVDGGSPSPSEVESPSSVALAPTGEIHPNTREVRSLVDEGRHEEAIRLLRDQSIRQRLRAVHLLTALDTTLIHQLGRRRLYSEVFDHYEWLRNSSQEFDVGVYQAAIRTAAAAKNVELAERFFGDLITSGTEINSHVLSAMIHAHAEIGSIGPAFKYLEWTRRIGIVPSARHHFGPIVSAFRDMQNPVRAENLIDEMETIGVQPDPHNYADVMQAWISAHGYKRAIDVYNRIIAFPDLVDHYHSQLALEAAAGLSDADLAISVVERMIADEIKPDSHHFGRLIGVLARAKRLSDVRKWFDTAQKYIPLDGFIVGEYAVALGECGSPNELDSLWSTMKRTANLQTTFSLPRILKAAIRLGNDAVLVDVRRLMAGLHLSEEDRNRLNADLAMMYASIGDRAEFENCRATVSDPQLLPELVVADLLLASTENDSEAIEATMRSLSDLRIFHSGQLMAILRAVCQVPLSDEIFRVVGEFARRSDLRSSSLGLAMSAVTRTEDFPLVEELFRTHRGSVIVDKNNELVLYNILLKAAVHFGDQSDTSRIWQEMLDLGLNPDEFSIGTLTRQHEASGTFTSESSMVRGGHSSDWRYLGIMLDDVVHELSQSVAQAGLFIKSALVMDAVKDNETLTNRIEKALAATNQIASRLDDYAAISAQANLSGRADVADAADWVIERTRSKFEPYAIEIKTNISQQIRTTAAVNPFYLRLALRALVSNAIEALQRYSPPDGARRIWINATKSMEARQGSQWINLIVRDNGPGIPEEIRDSIFERGFSTKDARGLGLGLSLVSMVAESCGGFLQLINNDSSGAEFWMRLPLSTDPTKEKTDDQQ